MAPPWSSGRTKSRPVATETAALLHLVIAWARSGVVALVVSLLTIGAGAGASAGATTSIAYDYDAPPTAATLPANTRADAALGERSTRISRPPSSAIGFASATATPTSSRATCVEQIVAKLREAEKLQARGLTIAQTCKRLGERRRARQWPASEYPRQL